MLRPLGSRSPLLIASLLGLSFVAGCGGSSDGGSDAAPGAVSGSVLNAPNPVSGVKVVLTGPGGRFETRTTSSGTYNLTGIPAGQYTVDFCGQGVFDSAGNSIPDKISLHLPSTTVENGSSSLGAKPVFLPERANGTAVDTAGSTSGVIPAGTVIANPSAGVSIVFTEETTVTFPSASDTEISITEVPIEQIPVALPGAATAASVFAIEPAGATFSVRPRVTFTNSYGLQAGAQGVSLMRLRHATATWAQFGTGSVSPSGDSITSDEGQGLVATGWHAAVVDAYCLTTVVGMVESGTAMPLEGVLVTAAGGLTAETDASGRFVIEGVRLPDDSSTVVVTALPPQGEGFLADESSSMIGACNSTTDIGTIILASVVVDETAPMIVSTFPADEAVDVGIATPLSVTFNELMSPGSLTDSVLQVTSGGAAIAADIAISHAGGQTTATVLPIEPLPADASILFSVRRSAMDAAGNRLEDAVMVGFNTAIKSGGGEVAVSITPDSPSALLPGDVLLFSAEVFDGLQNSVPGAVANWSSDTPGVLTIGSTGIVSALTPGTATIQASFGGATDSVTVTVSTPAIDDVTLTGGTPTIAVGSAMPLIAQAVDSGGLPLSGFQFNWTSSDSAIASVDAGGAVRALAAGGPVSITATEPGSGASATFAVTILDPSIIASVAVTPAITGLGIGISEQLNGEARDGQDSVFPGASFAWSSSNANVATVNAVGLVTGRSLGTATITATAVGSNAVSSDLTLQVFPDEELVVQVLSGDNGTDPRQYVTVVRHGTESGLFIESGVTNAEGIVNFGLTGSPRASLSAYFGSGDDSELVTVLDAPVGAITLSVPDGGLNVVTNADVSVDKGTNTIATVTGGIGGSAEIRNDVTGSPMTIQDIRIYETQSDGNASAIFTGSDASKIISGGFALDFATAPFAGGRGAQLQVDLLEANVTSVPFQSSTVVRHGVTTFRRSGLIFEQGSERTLYTDQGSADFVIPAGTDAIAFDMENSTTTAVSGRRAIFQSVPQEMSVSVPDLDMTDVAYDVATKTFSWNTTGTGASALDVGRMVLDFPVEVVTLSEGGGFTARTRWTILFDGTRDSITLPSILLPFTTIGLGLGMELELDDIDAIGGFDAYVRTSRAYAGRFTPLVLDLADAVDFVKEKSSMVQFGIVNPSFGTVTITANQQTSTVSDGELISLAPGTEVIVTATADQSAFVASMNSSSGAVTGVGTGQATVTFTTQSGDDVFVQFGANN